MLTRTDTIAAIATARAPAAIGIIRVSGPDAAAVLKAVVPDCRAAERPRRVSAGHARFPGTAELIDEVLCFCCRGPATATGEDIAEIHGHGGPFVMNQLLEATFKAGARPANPGEFTYRAFVNRRMDLTQAEAVLGLIGARSERAARVAMSQLGGSLGKALEGHFDTLNRIAANVEAGLDFPDEDLPLTLAAHWADQLSALASGLEALRESFTFGQKLRQGATIGIIGPPNAGKSSLFNKLVTEERAIVDAEPGTTRDIIEACSAIKGVPVVFTDTAGMRENASRVEQLGIDRSRNVARGADFVLLVLDGAEPMDRDETAQYQVLLSELSSNVVVALNKADLADWRETLPPGLPAPNVGVVSVSALTGAGLDRLVGKIGEALLRDCPGDTVILTTARQHEAVSDTFQHVGRAEKLLREGGEPELAAAELLWAREKIAGLLGRSRTNDMLSSLFSEFCIGK